MSKVVVVDKVDLVEVRIVRDVVGTENRLQVFVRYNLRSGNSVIQTQYREISAQLSASRQSSAASLFDGVLADVSAIEQV